MREKKQEDQPRSDSCDEQSHFKHKMQNWCTALTVQAGISTLDKKHRGIGPRAKLCRQTVESAMDVLFTSQKGMRRKVEVKFHLENFLTKSV